MKPIFKTIENENHFKENGFIVFQLLNEDAIDTLYRFYANEFKIKREVLPVAQNLPYYISIFDKDIVHRRKTDSLISDYVRPKTDELMNDYEVFNSNFMIKFPGDGQIEAHQDFNFVDESVYTAFNLWCPLVDTNEQNGGLFVIPGSHSVFKTQRGPNMPKALTQYNQVMKKYACPVTLRKGQAIIFDHKLIHYSPPNYTKEIRIAIQSVLKPTETPACHYISDEKGVRVKAYKIDKNFILEHDLWNKGVDQLELDHEQELIPFPDEAEVIKKLVQLKLQRIKNSENSRRPQNVFSKEDLQKSFEEDGYAKLPLLNEIEVIQLRELFVNYSGGNVKNTDYGMYISLEEDDVSLKERLIENISAIVLPRVQEHFINCKQHLGSFLVKAPGESSYTYPHQDWTFVDSPDFCSITIWIALVDVNESNGSLGFVKGSHLFFNGLVGSPSPEFQTLTQGHGEIFYEYLNFIPLKAGEAIAFDNRTIHGATPNLSSEQRVAVAIGVTPAKAQLYHYFLLPNSIQNGHRKIVKLKVDETFFHTHSVKYLKELYTNNKIPEGYEVETILDDEFISFSKIEIQELCDQAGLSKNGKQLSMQYGRSDLQAKKNTLRSLDEPISLVKRMWNFLVKS